MPIRATFSKKYLLRYLIIAVVGIGWTLYCAYDGLIAYPKKLEYSRAYFGIEAEDDGERAEKWKALTEEKGWPYVKGQFPEKKPKKIENDIRWQYGMGAVALLFGLPNLFFLLANLKSWIEFDQGKVSTSWRQEFEAKDVTEIDKSRWDRKGICKITYESAGKQQIFFMDDFKFNRAETDSILYEIEQVVGQDVITGGAPEKGPGKSKLESASEAEQD